MNAVDSGGMKCRVAGVDEAGRGPLAGPLVAAAVILDPEYPIGGLADSKKLSEKRRNELAGKIWRHASSCGLGYAQISEIDQLNIHHATLLAMQRAVASLQPYPDRILVDGKFCPEVSCRAESIIRGDETVAAISAASILAKVARDRLMVALDHEYPGYGFAANKGYPTAAHLAALQTLGVSKVHRCSFAPVRRQLEGSKNGLASAIQLSTHPLE